MTSPNDTPATLVLCVADANILFDLRNGRVLMDITALPYQFIVPDAVITELDDPLRRVIQNLGFEIGGLEAAVVSEIYSLRSEHSQLSVPDLFALFVARDRQAMLRTGDTRLRRLAEIRGLVVHGTLWVLDELFARQALNAPDALIALERIIALGGRLPASECQKRRLQWK